MNSTLTTDMMDRRGEIGSMIWEVKSTNTNTDLIDYITRENNYLVDNQPKSMGEILDINECC
jgi:hypothetical protein